MTAMTKACAALAIGLVTSGDLAIPVDVGRDFRVTQWTGGADFRFRSDGSRYVVQVTDLITYSGTYDFGQADMTVCCMAATVRF